MNKGYFPKFIKTFVAGTDKKRLDNEYSQNVSFSDYIISMTVSFSDRIRSRYSYLFVIYTYKCIALLFYVLILLQFDKCITYMYHSYSIQCKYVYTRPDLESAIFEMSTISTSILLSFENK